MSFEGEGANYYVNALAHGFDLLQCDWKKVFYCFYKNSKLSLINYSYKCYKKKQNVCYNIINLFHTIYWRNMFYPFMTLNDETEITHSEPHFLNGKEEVVVYIERPCDGGFDSASCILPSYRWEDIKGFSEDDIARLQEVVESEADVIIEFARKGGGVECWKKMPSIFKISSYIVYFWANEGMPDTYSYLRKTTHSKWHKSLDNEKWRLPCCT